jgi:predicted ArsR family transcriptional regulator
MDATPDPLAALSSLAEPTRRALYDAVVASAGALSREQAAASVGVPVHSAKFHLDRLVAEGLLAVEYRRPEGRSGPGAGRPTKLYRRSDHAVAVSLPPRRYDLVGDVLAEAVDRTRRDGTPLEASVTDAARDAGRRVADEPPHPRTRLPLRRVAEVLARQGYEPQVGAAPDGTGELALANCPFDRLAREHTDLVCGINLAFVEGAVEALGCANAVQPRLEPSPDACCVRTRAREA